MLDIGMEAEKDRQLLQTPGSLCGLSCLFVGGRGWLTYIYLQFPLLKGLQCHWGFVPPCAHMPSQGTHALSAHLPKLAYLLISCFIPPIPWYQLSFKSYLGWFYVVNIMSEFYIKVIKVTLSIIQLLLYNYIGLENCVCALWRLLQERL